MTHDISRRQFIRLGTIGLAGIGGCVEVSTDPRDGGDTEATTTERSKGFDFSTTSSRKNDDVYLTTEVPAESETSTEPDWLDSIETPPSEELPKPEIQRLISSDPKLVVTHHSVRQGADSFTATVQNEGDNGLVHVSLHWAEESSNNKPLSPVEEKSVFFNSGERREVALYASPPADVEEYEIRVRTATRGATIKNHGADGNIKIELKGDKLAGSRVLLDSQTLFISEGSTEDVEFDGDYQFGNDWVIEVGPEED